MSSLALLTGERTTAQEIEDACCEGCPKLTYKQRVIGFLCCFGLGVLIELGSFIRLVELVKGNPKPFAISYSIGNIVSLCSSFFLAGPWTQCKKMFAATRAIATFLYLASIATTLFVAYYKPAVPGQAAIIVLLVIVQMLALFWYFLSFIPYARDCVASSCQRACC